MWGAIQLIFFSQGKDNVLLKQNKEEIDQELGRKLREKF